VKRPAVVLDGKRLALEDILAVARCQAAVSVAPAVRARMATARAMVDELARGDEAHYGINTGFGALAEVRIPADKVELLQKNLIVSHAVGVGEPLSFVEARALMLLRASTLAVGHSGCRTLILDMLVDLLNAGTAPFVPRKGSDISIYSLPLHFGKRLGGALGGEAEPALDIPRYLAMFRSGRLALRELITECVGLDEINEAIARLRDGTLNGRCLVRF
jgi:hypothetical protein